MHPNRQFREQDRAYHEGLIDEVGFGMVFCETPDGPRVAHTPILSDGAGNLRFHLSRGNALTKHLPGYKALIVVNGPDEYISARWYSDPDQVPTWNYVAVEAEGTVEAMERSGLETLLEELTERQESRISQGTPWTMDKLSDKHRDGLLNAIVGFEMSVTAWRETVKISQNKSAETREEIIAGLDSEGASQVADMMRKISS